MIILRGTPPAKVLFAVISLICGTFFGLTSVLKLLLHNRYFWADENISNFIRPVHHRQVRDGDAYQLVQDHCKIPNVPVHSKILNKFIDKGLDPQLDNCKGVADFTLLKNNILYLTDKSLENRCCVHKISRPVFLATDDFILDPTCHGFQNGQLDVSKMEFIKIICNASTRSGPQKINFLANVLTTGRTERKAERWKLRSKRPMSIFVLIVDSASRTEAYRALNKTMDILVNKLNFVDFKGHHPVSEPTMNNALALLMGLRAEDIFKQYKFSRKDDFWDNTPIIWDIFNQMDFITGYFEDLPMHGTFNYGGQKGFLRRPTDLTSRPIMLALNGQFPYKRKKFCFGQRGVTKFMLDHQFHAMQHFKDTPSFFVSWPAWPQHDIPHSLYTQDDNYAEFFEKITKDEDLLENTLFVFSADHAAFKQDEYAKTQFGLLERRTVPLLIRVPNRLQREFPHVVDNLLWNSEIVTCHFDIYRTLIHLVKHFDDSGILEGQGSEKYGRSLLEKLPRTRSCVEASVIPTMCSCNLPLLKDDPQSMFPNDTHNPELLINKDKFPRFG